MVRRTACGTGLIKEYKNKIFLKTFARWYLLNDANTFNWRIFIMKIFTTATIPHFVKIQTMPLPVVWVINL